MTVKEGDKLRLILKSGPLDGRDKEYNMMVEGVGLESERAVLMELVEEGKDGGHGQRLKVWVSKTTQPGGKVVLRYQGDVK